MAVPVVDLVKISHRFKALVQPHGVLKPRVVVAADEVLVPLEPAQGVQRHIAAVIAHVPHQIHRVRLRDDVVPVAYQRLVHLRHGGKGAAGQQRRIVQVQVGGIVDHGVSSPKTSLPLLYHRTKGEVKRIAFSVKVFLKMVLTTAENAAIMRLISNDKPVRKKSSAETGHPKRASGGVIGAMRSRVNGLPRAA